MSRHARSRPLRSPDRSRSPIRVFIFLGTNGAQLAPFLVSVDFLPMWERAESFSFFQLSILLPKVGFRLFFGLTFRFIWLRVAHSLSPLEATFRQANC
jgi:hypothetical protein